ncbi:MULTISPECIES: hypothetical protein [Actinomycetes]|uniref:hypothetical protein n=1 Tax=Actinomycetes TaxID=1760 RepID=UPI0001B53A65|nr:MULTISPECIES: hypothetical protein [Actinomycetes]EFL07659.1 predicted protein [Streptomyces sp. AA4]
MHLVPRPAADVGLHARQVASVGAADGPETAFGYEKCALAPGDVADLVVLPGEALGELVVLPPPRSLVMKRGRIVARDGALTRSPSLIG